MKLHLALFICALLLHRCFAQQTVNALSFATLWETPSSSSSIANPHDNLFVEHHRGIAVQWLSIRGEDIIYGYNVTDGSRLWGPLSPNCKLPVFIAPAHEDHGMMACSDGIFFFELVNGSAAFSLSLPSFVSPTAPTQDMWVFAHDYFIVPVVDRSGSEGTLVIDIRGQLLTSQTPAYCPKESRITSIFHDFHHELAGSFFMSCDSNYFASISFTTVTPLWTYIPGVVGPMLTAPSVQFDPADHSAIIAEVGLVFQPAGSSHQPMSFSVVDTHTGTWVANGTVPATTPNTCNDDFVPRYAQVINGLFLTQTLCTISINSMLVGSFLGALTTSSAMMINFQRFFEFPDTVFVVDSDSNAYFFNVSTMKPIWVKALDIQIQNGAIGLQVPIHYQSYPIGFPHPIIQNATFPIAFIASGNYGEFLDISNQGRNMATMEMPAAIGNFPFVVWRIAPYSQDPLMMLEAGMLYETVDSTLHLMSLTVGWAEKSLLMPVVVQGVIYAYDNSGSEVIAVDRTDDELWRTVLPFRTATAVPVPFSNNYLLIVTDTSTIVALDAYTGALIQVLTLPAFCGDPLVAYHYPDIGPMVVDCAGQNAYFTASTYCLYHIDASLNLTAINIRKMVGSPPVLDEDNNFVYVMQENSIFAVSLTTGAITWAYMHPIPIQFVTPSSIGAPENMKKQNLFPFVYITCHREVLCLNSRDFGSVLWADFLPGNTAVEIAPVLYNDFFFTYTTTGILKYDVRLNVSNRVAFITNTTAIETSSQYVAPFIAPNGVIYVVSSNGAAAVSSVDGSLVWQTTLISSCNSIAFVNYHYLLAVSCYQKTVLLDALTGNVTLILNGGFGFQSVVHYAQLLYTFSGGEMFVLTMPYTLRSFNRGVTPPKLPTLPPVPQTTQPGYTPVTPTPIPAPPYHGNKAAPNAVRVRDFYNPTSANGNSAIVSTGYPGMFIVALVPDTNGQCTSAAYNSSTFQLLWQSTNYMSCSCKTSSFITTMMYVVMCQGGSAYGLFVANGTISWVFQQSTVQLIQRWSSARSYTVIIMCPNVAYGIDAVQGVTVWMEIIQGTPTESLILYPDINFNRTTAALAILTNSALQVLNLTAIITRFIMTNTTMCDFSTGSVVLGLVDGWMIEPDEWWGSYSFFIACSAATPDVTVWNVNFQLTTTTVFARLPGAGYVKNLLMSWDHFQHNALYVATESKVYKLDVTSAVFLWIYSLDPSIANSYTLARTMGGHHSLFFVQTSGTSKKCPILVLDVDTGVQKYNLSMTNGGTSFTRRYSFFDVSPTRMIIGALGNAFHINNFTGQVEWQYIDNDDNAVIYGLFPQPLPTYSFHEEPGVGVLMLKDSQYEAATVVFCSLYKSYGWSVDSATLYDNLMDQTGVNLYSIMSANGVIAAISPSGHYVWTAFGAPEEDYIFGICARTFKNLNNQWVPLVAFLTGTSIGVIDGVSGAVLHRSVHTSLCPDTIFSVTIPLHDTPDAYFFATLQCVYRFDPISYAFQATLVSPSGSISAKISSWVFSSDYNMLTVFTRTGAVMGLTTVPLKTVWSSSIFIGSAISAVLPSALNRTMVPHGTAQLANEMFVVSTLNMTAHFRWSNGDVLLTITPTGSLISFIAVSSDGFLYILTDTGLYRYSENLSDNNKLKWFNAESAAPYQRGLLSLENAGIVIVSNMNGVFGINAYNGKNVWNLTTIGQFGNGCAGAMYEFPSTDTFLMECDGSVRSAATGQVLYSYYTREESIGATIIDGNVYLFDGYRLQLVRVLDVAGLPQPVQPPVPLQPTVPPGYSYITPSPTTIPLNSSASTLYSSPPEVWQVGPDVSQTNPANSFAYFTSLSCVSEVVTVSLSYFQTTPTSQPTYLRAYRGSSGSAFVNRYLFDASHQTTWMGNLSATMGAYWSTVDNKLTVFDLSSCTIQILFSVLLPLPPMVPTMNEHVATQILSIPSQGLACIPTSNAFNDGRVVCIGIRSGDPVYGTIAYSIDCPGHLRWPYYDPVTNHIITVCLIGDNRTTMIGTNAVTGMASWNGSIPAIVRSGPKFTDSYVVLAYTTPPNISIQLFSMSTGVPLGSPFRTGFAAFGGSTYLNWYEIFEFQGTAYFLGRSKYLIEVVQLPSGIPLWTIYNKNAAFLSIFMTLNPRTAGIPAALICEGNGNTVTAYDLQSGTMLWQLNPRFPIATSFIAMKVIDGGKGLINTVGSNLFYIDLYRIQVMWRYHLPGGWLVAYPTAVTDVASNTILHLIATSGGQVSQILSSLHSVVAQYEKYSISTASNISSLLVTSFQESIFVTDALTGKQLVGEKFTPVAQGSLLTASFAPYYFRKAFLGNDVLFASSGSSVFVAVSPVTGHLLYENRYPSCKGFSTTSMTDGTADLPAVMYQTGGTPCLYVVAISSGVSFAVPTPSSAPLATSIVLSPCCILVTNILGTVYCYPRGLTKNNTVTRTWEYDLGFIELSVSTTVSPTGMNLLISHGVNVMYLVEETGVLLWRWSGTQVVSCTPWNNQAICTSCTGVIALNFDPALPRLAWSLLLATGQHAQDHLSTHSTPVVTDFGMIIFSLESQLYGVANNGSVAFNLSIPSPCTQLQYVSGSPSVAGWFLAVCGSTAIRDVLSGIVLLQLTTTLSQVAQMKHVKLDGVANTVTFLNDDGYLQCSRIPTLYLNPRTGNVPSAIPTAQPLNKTLAPGATPEGVFSGAPSLPPSVTNPMLGCALEVEGFYNLFVPCVNSVVNQLYIGQPPNQLQCGNAANGLQFCVDNWLMGNNKECYGGYIFLQQTLKLLGQSPAFALCEDSSRCIDGVNGAAAVCSALTAADKYANGATLYPGFHFPPPANNFPQFTMPPNTNTPAPAHPAPLLYAFTCTVNASYFFIGTANVPTGFSELVRAVLHIAHPPQLAFSGYSDTTFSFLFSVVDVSSVQSPRLATLIVSNASNVAASLHVNSILSTSYYPAAPAAPNDSHSMTAGAIIATIVAVLAVSIFAFFMYRHRAEVMDVFGGKKPRGGLEEPSSGAAKASGYGSTRTAENTEGEMKNLLN